MEGLENVVMLEKQVLLQFNLFKQLLVGWTLMNTVKILSVRDMSHEGRIHLLILFSLAS